MENMEELLGSINDLREMVNDKKGFGISPYVVNGINKALDDLEVKLAEDNSQRREDGKKLYQFITGAETPEGRMVDLFRGLYHIAQLELTADSLYLFQCYLLKTYAKELGVRVVE